MNKLFVHLAEGFEEIEAIIIIDVLRRAQLPVFSVSLTGKRSVKGSHGIIVEADLLFEEVDYSQGSMLILPGGMPGAKNINEHAAFKQQLVEYHEAGKYIAAICAAPLVLGGIGLLKGKRAVCYPGYEMHLVGAEVLTLPFVTDQKIITGRGIGVALPFVLEIVRQLAGEERAIQLKKAMLVE